MKPILTVEFIAKALDGEFKEESVTLHTPEELFEFVAPGGGCENIPDDVEEIRMVFLPPEHRNTKNPVADIPAILQLHRVLFTGPLAEISQLSEQIQDKAGRDELSAGFLRVIGLGG
jgi:hypothetical protein